MSYFAPYIDKTGFHMPTYIDIRDKQIEDAKNIFGQDIYLGDDSQDYQYICTIAEKIYDAFQIAQQVYANRAPNSAIGAGLDSIVKINGIKRKPETYSKANMLLTGIPGTCINKGIIFDKCNILWDLPEKLIFPSSGKINTTATCEVSGPIVADKGDITGIYNPTYGWNGAINTDNAILGSYIEHDSELRKRQSKSTAQPSITMLDGTSGAVSKVKGVTRSKVYENDTNEVNELGLPPHSITVIAENGKDEDIAKAIWIHKGIGCYTNGDIEVNVTDSKGQTTSIKFFRPVYIDISVIINVKSLTGYTTATTETIKKKLESYLNSLEIGSELTISALWGIALQAMEKLTNPSFSITGITAKKEADTEFLTDDIKMSFKEVCRGSINNITVNVV